MNTFFLNSLFANIKMAEHDPILGVTEAFNNDTNPNKINLGVGVYYDNEGKVPLLKCVRKAEEELSTKFTPRIYLPITGLSTYTKVVQELIFSIDNTAIQEARVITVQSLGGTGALKLGADFIKKFLPLSTEVWLSEPSWENHRALFEMAGLIVHNYPYYDAITHSINFNNMFDKLKLIPSGSIILLHACCHNPTGADLNDEQWTQIIKIIVSRGLIPFFDMAYQGFGDGINEDSDIIRRFTEIGIVFFVANSFSKSFSLYGERVGALSIVTTNSDEAKRILSQLKRIVRTNYSNPPTYGSEIVTKILMSVELRELWRKELTEMRMRIYQMRQILVSILKEIIPLYNFDFIINQRGMFSYSSLTESQVQKLRNKFSIYTINTGRICVAALNFKNINTVAHAIADIL